MTKGKLQNSAKVKVAVRVRPFNKRELELNTHCVIDMQDDQTFLFPPQTKGKQIDSKQTKTFAFDHAFWSMDPEKEKFADQEEVYNSLGVDVLSNAFSGYNACIFAYGQTGSGKSYSMMGSRTQPGLIPRLCSSLFNKIESESDDDKSFKIEVSYMEIYNEKVRDLLDPNGGKHQLKVREHKVLGPYVDGLQRLVAGSARDIEELMSEGSKSRTVAATKMNAESSRSHAVFTLIVTHTLRDLKSGVSGERVSKISLVDLAGSERSSKTGATGDRLKEGSNINKSLTTLGLVISSLADQASGKSNNKFVPYRDSTLTWILKDNLGGNSRTTMVATLSPSADNYEETLSTLRYADRAKRIVNKAVVNEDPNARIIRELREEVEKLQTQLKESESLRAPDLKEKLEESEKLIREISQTWEEKLRKTDEVHKKRQETLENMGISLETSGIKVEKTKCYLVNLNADPSLNELLVYYLKQHTVIGQHETSDVQLCGLGIANHHAEMTVTCDGTVVTVTPLNDARTCVNGVVIHEPTQVRHGDRILWGNNHFFRINVPRPSKLPRPSVVPSAIEFNFNSEKLDSSLTESQLNESQYVSYEYAQQEVLLNQAEAPIQETIANLEREFKMLQVDTNHSSDNTPTPGVGDDERKKYEQEIVSLRRQLLKLSPAVSTSSLNPDAQFTPPPSSSGLQQYKNHKNEREKAFQSSIVHLREELVRAQTLAQEANALASVMKKDTQFTVTLRIPTQNLTPNRQEGALLCEPAIQVVRQGKDCQLWFTETLANRLVDMRELYDQYNATDCEQQSGIGYDELNDPFNEIESGQIVIGVANVFLACLLQDQPLIYPVPIINQHGQVAGKLLISIQRLAHPDNDSLEELVASGGSSSSDNTATCYHHDESFDHTMTSSSADGSFRQKRPLKITCRLTIVEAQGLLPTLSHFVQCQYTFPGLHHVTLVPPDLSPDEVSPKHRSSLNIRFAHTADFVCDVTDDFVERMSSGLSLAIEVWGHRDRYHDAASAIRRNPSLISTSSTCSSCSSLPASSPPAHPRLRHHPPASGRRTRNPLDSPLQRSRGSSFLNDKKKSLEERWSEVMKKMKMDVSVQELVDSGEYEPVEVARHKPQVSSVGCFMLKQGQSRRLCVNIVPLDGSGTLPLLCDSVASVYAGSISTTSSTRTNGLDSYQDKDLTYLKEEWLEALERRKYHLNKQIKEITSKEVKTELERERENTLFDQWVMLTEEMNAVHAPGVNSGVPGSPASWEPPLGTEMHIPVLFLNLDPEEVDCNDVIRTPAGLESDLPDEVPGTFVSLPFVRPPVSNLQGEVSAVVSWDSSLHDSVLLNRVTPTNERVFIIVKVHVRLSHPVEMDLVLRKRICVSVYRQKTFAAAFRRKLQSRAITTSGVIYEVVSNLPFASSEGDDHETLAVLAASGAQRSEVTDDEMSTANNEEERGHVSHFEKYVMRASRSVDNILSLDRIRQEVALRNVVLQNSNNSNNANPAGWLQRAACTADVISTISRRYKAGRPSSVFSTYQAGD